MKKVDKILLVDDDNIANFVNKHLIRGLDLADELIIKHNVTLAKDVILNIMHQLDDDQFQDIVILLDTQLENAHEMLPSDLSVRLPYPACESLFMINVTYNRFEDPALSFELEEVLDKPLTREKLSLIWQKNRK